MAVFAATRDATSPWENLVLAREEDVRLVVVGGAAHYGEEALMKACGAKPSTSVPIGKERRSVALVDPKDEGKAWTWSKLLADFETVSDDPASVVKGAMTVLPPAADGEVGPLVVELDMPGSFGLAAGPPPHPEKVTVPKPGSLRHDKAWHDSTKDRGFHDNLLCGLAGYF